MQVLAGERGILSGLRRGATWIEISTNSEAELKRFAAVAKISLARIWDSRAATAASLACHSISRR